MRSSALGVEQRLPVNRETPAGAQQGDYLVGDYLVKSCLKLFAGPSKMEMRTT
jgi:hypothetical protein